MNRKKVSLALLALSLLAAVSCTYDEQPARTTDATTSYVTPKGEIPTADERAYVQSLIDEYNKSIK